MAFRPVTGGNSRGFDRKRPAVQRHQPPHRSSEPHAASIPLHRFRKREFRDQLAEEVLEPRWRAAPVPASRQRDTPPSESGESGGLGRHSLPCGKSRRCSGRLASLIERHRFRRPHRFLDHRGLLSRESLDHQSQPSRSSQRAAGLKRETSVFEQLLSRIFEEARAGAMNW